MQNKIKLKQILQNIPHGTVVTSLWLENQGVSRSLRSACEKNGFVPDKLGSLDYTYTP